jgi:hypothetical protein
MRAELEVELPEKRLVVAIQAVHSRLVAVI